MALLSNNDLTLTIKAVDNASKDLSNVSKKVGDLGSESDKSSGYMEKLNAAGAKLGGVLKAAVVAVAALAVTVGTAGASIGIGFNSSVEQAQSKLMAFMKDNGKVAETLAWVKQEAAATQFSFTEMADAAANLTPVAKTSGKSLESLVRQAEVLAALNPAEGLTGAVFSLREALSGDWVSIVDRFNLPRKRINELKEQGVPAMEIISRTLGEMGIDYSLVAAQGQTLSARFDQLKDKLTMMAGAATKPIFDRLSSSLNEISNNDFVGWGERAGTVIANLIDTGTNLWNTLVTLLKPSVDQLTEAYDKNLRPSMEKLQPVFEVFAQFFGMTLVVALTFAINLLTAIVNVLGWVGSAVQNTGTAIGNFAYGAGAFIVSLKQRFDEFLGTVQAVWNRVTTMDWGKALSSIGKSLANSVVKLIEDGINGALSGLPGSPKVSLPRFARGTDYAPGGLALVGEEGPELVNLPRGSQVKTAAETRQIVSQTTRGGDVYVTNYINSQIDYDKGIAKLGFMLRGAAG